MEEIDIGDGIFLNRTVRPRARRGPDELAKPFDAGELHAKDKTLDLIDWTTTSLLVDLRDKTAALFSPDQKDARDQEVRLLLTELERRGLPAESILTDEYAFVAARGAFLAAVLITLKPENAVYSDETIRSFAARALNLPQSEPEGRSNDPEMVAETMPSIVRLLSRSAAVDQLAAWMQSRGPDGVMLLETPRSIDELEACEPAKPIDSDATWLVDRLTGTYLEEWSTGSLKREWRWRHTQHPPPAPPRVMSERNLEESKLACELADRLSDIDDHKAQATPDLIALAARFLESGERKAAASIFEHARLEEPDNPGHTHNKGFCLVPDDPKSALVLLQEAHAAGYAPVAINAADQALALALLGRLQEARQLASRAQHALGDIPSGFGAYLWKLDLLWGEGPVLATVAVRAYVTDLVERIEESIAKKAH